LFIAAKEFPMSRLFMPLAALCLVATAFLTVSARPLVPAKVLFRQEEEIPKKTVKAFLQERLDTVEALKGKVILSDATA
jgi:hypothetical protein